MTDHDPARMLDRKWILRVLLGSLAMAAVCGAMAVLVGEMEVIGRVAATALVVAIGCACTLGAARLYEAAATRPAGTLGLVATVLDFLLAMLLIWGGAYLDHEWRVGATIAQVAVAAAAGMAGLNAIGEPRSRRAGGVILGLTGIVLLLAQVATWWQLLPWGGPGSHRVSEKIWATAMVLAGIGLAAVLALLDRDRGDRWWWRWAGVLAATVAFGIAATGIWTATDSDPTLLTVFLATAFAIAHANGMRLCRLTDSQRWLRGTAVATGIATAVLVTFLVAAAFDHRVIGIGEQMLGRLTAAAAVIAGCATLAVLIVARFNRPPPLDGHVTEVRLECPRCRKKQAVALGGAACDSCGLNIEVRIDEAACPACGYSLRGLHSDRCPECGTAVHSPAGEDPVPGAPTA